MKMEYATEFIPVEIKYDFINKNDEPRLSDQWIGCRLNVKPLEKFDGCLQVMCYPKRYDEVSPYFLFEFDIKDLKCGPVASRTKNNVYGLFWTIGTKRCKLFIAFDEKCVYDTYITYFKDVLRSLEKCVKQQEVAYENSTPFSLNLSWNDGIVALLNHTKDISSAANTANDTVTENERISDASEIYQEVELRHPEHQKQRSMRRPIAILSDFFTTKRSKSFSSVIKTNKTPELPPRNRLSSDDGCASKSKKPLKKKRSIWNLMSKGKKCDDTNSTNEQRMKKKSSASSLTDIDLSAGNYFQFESFDDIFDLNSIPDINDLLKPTEMNLKCSTTPETKQSNVSLNILWSHNLSRSPASHGNISDINLVGANVNKEQIHSEIFIEQDSRRTAFGISAPPNFLRFRQFNVSEVDENGYAVMRPIINNENQNTQLKNNSMHTTYVSIDDIKRNAMNLECNYDIIRTPPRRKLSFESDSSSGCSSDSEDRISDSQSEKEQFNDDLSDDEAISLNYIEKSPTKSTNIKCNSTNSAAPNENDCELVDDEIKVATLYKPLKCINTVRSSTPYKINSDLNQRKLHLITIPSNESAATVNIETKRDQQIVKTKSLAELNTNEKCKIHDESAIIGKIDKFIKMDDINTNERATEIYSDSQSKTMSKRIWRTCTEIRKITVSLVSTRRAMLNFAY